jgi:hypothetical protein
MILSIGEQMFIKRGDGKIMSVIEEEELTEEQKKKAQALSQKTQTVKESIKTDSSQVKKSGS